MNINIDNIKNLDDHKIYEVLNHMFISLYKDYDYIFTEEEFKYLVLHEINESKNTYLGDIDYSDYIRGVVTAFFDDIIISYVNFNRQFDLINKYIDKKFKNVSDFKDSICCLKELQCFVEIYNLELNSNVLCELISKNKIFSNSIELLVNNYYKQIVSGNLECIFDDSKLVLIIETYCRINNIEISIQQKICHVDDLDKQYKKNIYNYLEEYSREEIDYVLGKLSQQEKELLRIRYGDDLENPVFRKLTKEQHYDFHGLLLPKIKRMLKNGGSRRIYRSIYELALEYPKEEVDLVISKLSNEEKELLRIRYGDDLSNPVFVKLVGEQRVEFYNLVYRIRSALKKRYINTPHKKNIYNYLEDYSREEVDLVISRLTDEEKELLRLRYGCDLENPIFKKLTDEQRHEFYHLLLPKIKKMLKYNDSDTQFKTIYEFLEVYTKEEIDLVLSKLTDEEKELLRLRYGDDLENPVFSKLTKEQRYKFYKLLLKKIKNMLKNEGTRVKGKTIYEFFSNCSKEEMDLVISKLSNEEKELLRIRYGDDLENPVFGQLTEEQRYKFYQLLLPRINTRLKKENSKRTKNKDFDSLESVGLNETKCKKLIKK